MKKAIVLIFFIVPFFLSAQPDCSFFENSKFTIEKVNLNSSASDFGASFVGNELWYSAFSSSDIDIINKGEKKNVFYDIFVTPVDVEGNITGNSPVSLEKISSGYHAGPVSFCAATKELFVTFSNHENPEVQNAIFQKANIRLKIVVFKESGGNWNLVGELPFNNPLYSVGHPAISTTGDTLFFTSNKPEQGIGKADIYMATRENGVWGEMKNIGESVNTVEDDMFPFLFKNNMLIFASNGRQDSQGGLDLYYSCITPAGFTEPVSIKGLNSASDDFGLVIHPLEEVGYFGSKKTGGEGDDDIYKVVFAKKIMVNGRVIDDATEQAIAGAEVVLTDCSGNPVANTTSGSDGQFSFRVEEMCLKAKASKPPYHDETGDVKDNFVLLRMKGDYNLELLVRDKQSQTPIPGAPVRFSDTNNLTNTDGNGLIKRELARNTNYTATSDLEGYMNESASFTTVKHPIGTVKIIINVEKVKVGQTFALENIFYNFDKWDILPESEIELDKLIKIMNDNPEWKVELGSHTDCRGSDTYNKTLSQKRSNSAVSYIISKGIGKERIIAKGYGETQLVNRCDDGVQCTEAEHRQNRRTEFKILKME